MIVYAASKDKFIKDVLNNKIEKEIYTVYQEKIGKTSKSEIASWTNSMMYMSNILIQSKVPNDANIAIEYQVPNTSKRVDFIISGLNEQEEESVIIVELKQWSDAQKTNKDGIIKSFVGSGHRELTHPSYQAWTYAELIREYNETVRRDNIQLYPCAYLHNFSKSIDNNPVLDAWYKEYLDLAPAFLRDDTEILSDFINNHIKKGDRSNILYRIDHGRIKPSKSLGDKIGSMLDGNREFNLIEEQKVAYEMILELLNTLDVSTKRTVIVKGGPGTGKSIIAIHLLVKLINEYGMNTQYITKNSGPRIVYSELLKGYRKKSFIDNLFKVSDFFYKFNKDYFDCLIVDEAHRLIKKSRYAGKNGESQIKEIINCSRLSVFFIDDAQRVKFEDVGSVDEIKQWANDQGSEIYELELASQFRCNGSDGYLAWLDNWLGVRETANSRMDPNDFDVRVLDSPNEVRDLIFEKNKINNKARLLAGYCWEWEKSKRNDTNHHDIVIPKHHFSMSWNLGTDGMTWLLQPTSVNEVGCIHTSQGLELDYIGVIIGDDLRYENNKVVTDPNKRAKTDFSLHGWQTSMKKNPIETQKKVNEIIRNTYRTLLTRGMKGCYIYCTDEALQAYIRSKIIGE